jgi:hypothetical protein
MEVGRRLARRRLGIASFGLLAAEAGALTFGLFYGGEVFSTNIKAAETLLLGLFWTQTVIVMTYLGVSVTEAIKK